MQLISGGDIEALISDVGILIKQDIDLIAHWVQGLKLNLPVQPSSSRLRNLNTGFWLVKIYLVDLFY